MSGTNRRGEPVSEAPVTQADVHAAGASASEADVLKANTLPAASDPFAAFMDAMGARMRQVENVLGLAEPFVNEAAGLAGLVMPEAAPILTRLPQIEAAIADLTEAASNVRAAPAAPGEPVALARVETVADTVTGILSALHTVFNDSPTMRAALPPRDALTATPPATPAAN